MAKRTRDRNDVRQLPSGRWQGRFKDKDGKSHSAGTFTNRNDAEKAVSRAKVDIERGVWVDPKAPMTVVPTFRAFAERTIDQRLRGGQLRLTSATEYKRYLNKGLAGFADLQLDQINKEFVAAWHADRTAEAPFAAAVELRCLRSILTTAFEYGHVKSVQVPTQRVKAPTARNTRPPTSAELATILATISPRFRLGVLLAAYGGLRLSEWRCLRRQDLTKTDGRYVISITRQARHIAGTGWVVTPPKSARGVREVALPSHSTADIDEHMTRFAGDTPAALLFPPMGGSSFFHDSDFNKTWNTARDAAGVRSQVREHDLRGWFGSARLEGGATPLEVRDSMGHKDLRTTERHYLRRLSDREAEQADAMPALPKAKPSNVRQIGS